MRAALVAAPFLWLLALVLAPALLLGWIAFGSAAEGVPPVAPPLAWQAGALSWQGSLESFALLLEDPHYAGALLRSLLVAAGTAALALLLAYPMAFAIAEARPRWRLPLLALVLAPVWTGLMPRLGAWIGLLRDEGWINGVLLRLGLIEAPLTLLFSDIALYAGMLHSYLPYAVLPLAIALSRRDRLLEAAAADLGAAPARVFLSVTLPLSLPAAAAAFLLVFIPAAGEFVIPELLGPPGDPLLGRVIWAEFFQSRDWPLAAALALTLLAVLALPIRAYQRLGQG
ncbi:ABC transporter permease subunit [Siccirubricoccus sp. KC 17139]|uniref:ABC transporter permease subunit n=1 Tax=Siccirubricoccus soli TaxID=2899147 RepID=A0ABT1DBE7_9PROT|nr:ABC transporter permease subunit [Siccirubricoccus soli]MCO6419262.1 ABC transporter permease subunit [Siccirubricoccus soli]MCP2685397.1 ABC transporter permease subunit [Siccirubricoccus soli]